MPQPSSQANASPAAGATHGSGTGAGAGLSAGQMGLVLDVSRMLAVTADLDLLLRRIAEAVTALLNCDRASIFLHDAEKHELWTKVALGREEIRMPDGAGLVGHVFHSNRPLHAPAQLIRYANVLVAYDASYNRFSVYRLYELSNIRKTRRGTPYSPK